MQLFFALFLTCFLSQVSLATDIEGLDFGSPSSFPKKEVVNEESDIEVDSSEKEVPMLTEASLDRPTTTMDQSFLQMFSTYVENVENRLDAWLKELNPFDDFDELFKDLRL
ncbi:hypothetical protein [Candidatus Paracaedibacter symbiosus]|uniref:hypothetical protein n=1 Tax=Candidatus Paracaedibacter symbiosus TaxID=244582 RepID=UPI0012EBB5FC|nr:hypothetical protein [Candidatus Paracaedibacter symbiosus]